MMKRVITVILAVALLVALAVPAVADAFTLYATKSGVKVYAKKDTSSRVYKKLSKGQKVLIEKKSGKWYAILVEDPAGDGQTLGWIQAKYLSTTKPSKDKKKKTTPAPKSTTQSTKEINRVLDTMRDVAPYDAEVVTKTERGTVALRRQPTQAGALILHLMNGAPVRVLAEGDGWFQVSDPTSGNTGYMASKYIVRTGEVADDGEADEVSEAASAGSHTIVPIAVSMDVNHLPDGVYPVSFEPGDTARLASGIYMNAVTVYTMDLYATSDIENLDFTDTVVVDGKPLTVESVEEDDGYISINGGLTAPDGMDFIKMDDGNYRANGSNDMPVYTKLGVTTLLVDESAVFTDSADIDGAPVTAEYDSIVDAIQNATFTGFYAENTTVTIQSGRVVRIDRTYMP